MLGFHDVISILWRHVRLRCQLSNGIVSIVRFAPGCHQTPHLVTVIVVKETFLFYFLPEYQEGPRLGFHISSILWCYVILRCDRDVIKVLTW